MPEVNTFYCIILFIVPAATALLILILGRFRIFREWLALAGMTATFIISVYIFLNSQRTIQSYFNNNLRIDAFSGLIIALISLIGLAVLVYSVKYLKTEKEKGIFKEKKLKSFYWQFMLLISVMLLLATSNNIVLLWVVIEATTLAATILVSFYWNKNSLEAGFKFVMILTVGMSIALIGCILLYSGVAHNVKAGEDPLQITTIISVVKSGIIPKSILSLSAAFLLVGFGTKAGIAPFHTWMPDAYAESPVPVSSILSGVVVNMSIYALIRIFSIFYSAVPVLNIFVIVLGLFSMLLGVLMMFVQDDIKRFLAYSSVSQIGYIILGFGLAGSQAPAIGTMVNNGAYLGMYGAIFHIINHALIKTLLFLSAGAVIYATGIRRMSELGGLGKKMPITAVCFFIAGLSISGIPFLNGFASKFIIFMAGAKIDGMIWTTVIAIICSILTLANIIIILHKIFMGNVSENLNNYEVKEVPASLWTVMVFLCMLCILLGVYPQIMNPFLDKAASVILSVIY